MTPNSDQGKASVKEQTDVALDITREICPMTFVRTRLLLDRLAPGATVRIRLKGREPLANVPRSARELGHAVLGLVPEVPGAAAESDCWILTLRKKGV
jgi:TusA-related sulfurtransferase